MDTTKDWEQYHTLGLGPESDEVLVHMIQEVIDVFHTIQRIYGPTRSQFVRLAVIADYQTLSGMAWARKIKEIPQL